MSLIEAASFAAAELDASTAKRRAAVERVRLWRLANPEKLAAQRAAYRLKHKEKRAAYNREYYERFPEKRKAWGTAWKEANKERIAEKNRAWRQNNRERIRETARAWRLANLEATRARVRNRRSRRNKASGAHSKNDIQTLLRLQGYKCANCKKSVRKSYHVDHIVALKTGGTNDRRNLQILCPTCNRRKWTFHPIEFAQREGRLL